MKLMGTKIAAVVVVVVAVVVVVVVVVVVAVVVVVVVVALLVLRAQGAWAQSVGRRPPRRRRWGYGPRSSISDTENGVRDCRR